MISINQRFKQLDRSFLSIRHLVVISSILFFIILGSAFLLVCRNVRVMREQINSDFNEQQLIPDHHADSRIRANLDDIKLKEYDANHAKKIVQNLLGFARISEGLEDTVDVRHAVQTVLNIVKKYGERIGFSSSSLEDNPDKPCGTTFTVTIPTSRDEGPTHGEKA